MLNDVSMKIDLGELPWVTRDRGTFSTSFKLLAQDTGSGMYATAVRYPAGTLIGRHRHLLPVYAYTVAGAWHYLEHDWVASAGSFVLEHGGSEHTLEVVSAADVVGVFISGPRISLGPNNEMLSYRDGRGACLEYHAGLEKAGIPWPAHLLGEYRY
jgi:2,4'-dihydroxyacetophenone dioxygenase